jgi:hypothetical protein
MTSKYTDQYLKEASRARITVKTYLAKRLTTKQKRWWSSYTQAIFRDLYERWMRGEVVAVQSKGKAVSFIPLSELTNDDVLVRPKFE